MKILVTGAAGFIGFFVSAKLAGPDFELLGVDNLNGYYDVALKEARLGQLADQPNFRFLRGDLSDRAFVEALFRHKPDVVIHLAAQAGVRYSIENPYAYVEANILGFMNILEGCRHAGVRHLIYASSSSVYGGNKKLPFSVSDSVDHPVSLYAATKKSNELMAHTYSHLYGVPTTGLRFFTVYGPWGRPDMSYFKFVKAIYEGQTIDVYNHGNMQRDFTYIDDIVWAIAKLIDKAPAASQLYDEAVDGPASSWAPYRVFNIGNRKKQDLMEMIGILEQLTGRTVQKRFLPMQPGDVVATYADVSALEAAVGEAPHTELAVGLSRFVDWYKSYYRVS